MAQIDNLSLQITANTDKAVADLERLATALSALKAVADVDHKKLNKVAAGMGSVVDACASVSLIYILRVERLADAIERIASIDASNLTNVGKAIKKATSEMIAKAPKAKDFFPPAVIDTSFKSPSVVSQLPAIREINEVASLKNLPAIINETSGALAGANEEAKEFYGSFSEIKDPLEDLVHINTTPIKELGKAFNTFKNSKVGGMAIKAVSTEMNHLKSAAQKALSPLQKLGKALLRIAIYRAIRSLIKNITAGIKEGIENLAIYSQSINNMDAARANETMSKLATAFLYLKNSIAAALMPIIQQFTPVIVEIIDRCVDAINVINQLISALQGKTVYTRAKKVWVDYAASLDKSTESAKKLHHQLAGFDELNNLTATNNTGFSLNPEDMFETVAIESKWLDIAEKIRQKFNDILELVGLIGTGIAAWALSTALLQGLDAFGIVGKLARTTLSLGIALHLIGMGLSFKAFWDSLTEGFSTKVMLEFAAGGILQFAGAGLQSLTGGGFWSMVMPWLNLTDAGMGGVLAPFLATFVTVGVPLAAAAFVDMVKNGVKLGNTLLLAAGTTWATAGIFAVIGSFLGPIGTAVGLITGAIVGGVTSMFTALLILFTQNFDKINVATVDFLNNLGLHKLADIVNAQFKALKPIFKGLNDILEKTVDFLVSIKTSAEKAFETFKETGSIKQAWDQLTTSIKANFESLKLTIKNIIKDVAETYKNAFDLAKTKLVAALENVNKVLEKYRTIFITVFTSTIASITSVVSLGMGGIVSTFSKNFSIIENSGKGIGTTLAATFSNAINMLILTVNNTLPKITNAFINVRDGIIRILKYVKDSIKDAFSLDFAVNAAQRLLSTLESISRIKISIPTISSTVTSVVSSVSSRLTTRASGGFVPSGDLFVANENGAELVGSVNGKTAVANNEMITSAIAQATYEAMSRALGENNNNVNIVVEGDGDRMFKVFQKKQRDYQRSTGLVF